MTINDQINILDKKILQNEAQYDLDKKAAIIHPRSSKNLDKVEYLTGEDLGLKPNTIEEARFEYSPLCKIFNKGLDKDDKKEGLFKRLKNIEGKIKNEDKKELEAIKNEIVKDGSTVANKKPKETVLLKDKLDFTFCQNFGQNFNSTGKKHFLKKLAQDKKRIDYNNLFLEMKDKSVSKDADFLKEFGTLYDLLLYFFDCMRMTTSVKDQIMFLEAVTTLEAIILH